MTILVSLTAIVWSLSMDSSAVAIDQAQQFVAVAQNALLVTRWETQQPANADVAANLAVVTLTPKEIEPLSEPTVVEPENPAEEMAGDEDDADDAPLPNAIDPDIGPPPELVEPEPETPAAEAVDAAEAAASQAARAETQQTIRELWRHTSDLASQLAVRVPALLSKTGLIPSAHNLGLRAALPR